MSNQPDTELARRRDDVFRAIGRNVVMFQDIERMLKIVLNRGRFTATRSQLKTWKDQGTAPYARRTLGALVEPVIKHHLSPAEPDVPVSSEGEEVTVSFEFRLELNVEQQADFKRRLEDMVEQRNDLIHHLLDWLRLDTLENCKSACGKLQRQRDDIQPIHRDVKGILEAFLETKDQLPRMIDALAAEMNRANQNRKGPGH